jgi:hypothetical protein
VSGVLSLQLLFFSFPAKSCKILQHCHPYFSSHNIFVPRYIPTYKAIADALQHDDGVEVGSVNCIAEPVICQNWCVRLCSPRSDVLTRRCKVRDSVLPHHPRHTRCTLNATRGTRQQRPKLYSPLDQGCCEGVALPLRPRKPHQDFLSRAIQRTRDEQRHVPRRRLLGWSPLQVRRSVVNRFTLHFVVRHAVCSPCKTAASNALRLSSALRRAPPPHAAHVSLVDCEQVCGVATVAPAPSVRCFI